MREAATLILLKSPDDPQVYWARRGDDAPFLGGFHVFPGGLLEPQDSVGSETDALASARRAAVRETLEETGFRVSSTDGKLKYLGAWVAPPYLVYPIKTHFFYRWVSSGSGPAPIESGELMDGEWIHPSVAVERWNRSEVLVAPPTMTVLRALVDGKPESISRAFESGEARGLEPTLSPVRPKIMMLPLRTPTLPPATHTNCYVLGDEELLVVEPATPESGILESLFEYLDHRLSQGAGIKALILTHHHHDHIGGIEACVARYGVPVWAHRETAKRVHFKIDRLLEEEDEIALTCGQRWRVLFTPGHAPGHICLLDEETGSMVVGDMVAGIGSILVEPTDGDMAAYLHSLRRMKAENPSCLMPSHGPYIAAASSKLQAYIDHRLEREESLLAALKQTEQFLELVAAVYADVPEILRAGTTGGLAGLSLRAHLDKLVSEGRVVHDGDRWQLVV